MLKAPKILQILGPWGLGVAELGLWNRIQAA